MARDDDETEKSPVDGVDDDGSGGGSVMMDEVGHPGDRDGDGPLGGAGEQDIVLRGGTSHDCDADDGKSAGDEVYVDKDRKSSVDGVDEDLETNRQGGPVNGEGHEEQVREHGEETNEEDEKNSAARKKINIKMMMRMRGLRQAEGAGPMRKKRRKPNKTSRDLK